jgi:glycosyltransferase involved in cell wall biosynthesis
MLSVVLPTLNEEQNSFYPLILESLKRFDSKIETVIVDGGSGDNTRIKAQQLGFEVHTIANSNRAARLNLGIRLASNPLVLLHHPRTLIEATGIEHLLANPDLTWGGFTHKFNHKHPVLMFTSWYSNSVRGKRFGILYLDHCIFAQKKLLESCDFLPEMDIFEDTELSKRLARHGKPHLLPHLATTSAVRFLKNGIYRQAFLNQYLKLAYYLKTDPKKMNSHYEKDLPLNVKYKD